MAWQDVKLLFQVHEVRERLVCMLATIAGMRPGEIFALPTRVSINGLAILLLVVGDPRPAAGHLKKAPVCRGRLAGLGLRRG